MLLFEQSFLTLQYSLHAMIHIDGSYGEGGGQIVRTALALSTLTGESFVVEQRLDFSKEQD